MTLLTLVTWLWSVLVFFSVGAEPVETPEDNETLAAKVEKTIETLSDSQLDAQQPAKVLRGLRRDLREMEWEGQKLPDALAKAAIDVLRKALAHEDTDVRYFAIGSLETIGPRAGAAVPALVGALEDPTDYVRYSAVNALAATQRREPAVVRAFLARLTDEGEDVGDAATHALAAMGTEVSDQVMPEIRKLLKHDSQDVRARAIEIGVGMSGKREFVQAALKLFKNATDMKQRERIGMMLAAVGPRAPDAAEAVPEFLKLLDDESVRMRALGAFGLARLGKPSPEYKAKVPALEKLLDHRDEDLGMIVALAILKIQPDHAQARSVAKRVLPRMIDHLSETPEMITATGAAGGKRDFFCDLCAALGPDAGKAVALLRRIAREAPDKVGRQFAADALSKVGVADTGSVPPVELRQ